MGAFSVSSNGSSVQVATGPQSLLSINHPLTKLDTTKDVSFQTISILFNNEPPQPAPNSYTNTPIYTIPAHGYNYTPAVWASWQNQAADPLAFPDIIGTHALRSYAFGDDSNSIELLAALSGGFLGAYEQTLIAEDIYNDAGSPTVTTIAYLVAKATDTGVVLSILKENITPIGGVASPLHLAGITLNIRLYVFTEPATTSTY